MPIEDMTPASFDARRKKGERWQLLDVREAWEHELARVPDATHIPMAEVPARHAELDPEQPTAVICHSGVRSARVATYLDQIGFDTVVNVAGGIDAWSVEIDSSVPRY